MLCKTKLGIFFLLIILSVLLIAFENNLFGSKTTTTTVKVIKSINVKQKQQQNITTLNEIFIANQREWLINNQIAQYSPRLYVLTSRNRLVFEALILYNNSKQTSDAVRGQVKFLVLFESRKTGESWQIMLDVQEAFGYVTIISVGGIIKYLWKVRTEIPVVLDDIEIDSTLFLLTDLKEYEKMMDNELPEFLRNALTYQIPIVQIEKDKKPAIGHCVHMVRNLNEKKLKEMKEWLFVQELVLGIDKLKLYFYQVDKSAQKNLENFIQNNIQKMKVEIIDFRFENFLNQIL